MLSLGSHRHRKKALALMKTHHCRYVLVELMDLSHNYLADASDMVLGGQVNIDTTGDTTRQMNLDLLDPYHKLKLDPQAPSDGSMFFTKMAKVTVVLSTPDFSEQYMIPIFCGPLTKVDRSGPVVSVEGMGKERLSMRTIWTGKTYKKGLKKTDVLRSILLDAGESARKLDIPDLDARMRNNLSANRQFTFWNRARASVKGMTRQLFYDGRGQGKFRKLPGKPVFVFRDDETMLTDPQVSYNIDDVRNAVEIIGGKPKGKKKKVHVKLAAPKNHPLSPWKMGRNNVPAYLPEVIEDDSIKSKKEARRVAKRELRRLLVESIDVTFDSLPIFLLEELDLCKYVTENSSAEFRLKQISYPLTADGVSTVGYLKKVTPKKSYNRNHRSRAKTGRR